MLGEISTCAANACSMPFDDAARLLQTQLRERAVAGLAGVLQVQVPEHGVGVLSIDGRIERLLAPGSHAFWKQRRPT
jgi:hypothetical protein